MPCTGKPYALVDEGGQDSLLFTLPESLLSIHSILTWEPKICMKNSPIFALFITVSGFAFTSESFVDTHDPNTYFFPENGYYNNSFESGSGSHTPIANGQRPNERFLELMIIDESIILNSILWGLRTDILASLSEIGAKLDFCAYRMIFDNGNGIASVSTSTKDFNECANGGSNGTIVDISINYSLGLRAGIIRVSLAHKTRPVYINIRYFEYEKL